MVQPLQASHDGGSSEAFKLFIISFCIWELLYHLSRKSIRLCLEKPPEWMLHESLLKENESNQSNGNSNGNGTTKSNSRQNGNTNKTKLQQTKLNLIQRAPSYCTSLIHAIYVSYRGILHLYNLYNVSNLDKVYITPLNHDETMHTPHQAHMAVCQTNIIFLSYLIFDLIHVSLHYPKLGGVDTIMHHVLFASCSVINGTYGILPFPFGWLIVGEVSTIFLNWRWILLKTGRSSGRMLDVVNWLFAITFFVTRNVIYTFGMGHLFWFCWEEIGLLTKLSGVPLGWLGMTLGCVVLGWGLNVVWGCKILSMVLGGGSKKMKKE